MSKLLIALSVVQTVAIGALALAVVDLKKDRASAPAAEAAPQPQPVAARPLDAASASIAPAELRAIIREELSASAAHRSAAAPEDAAPAAAPAARPSPDDPALSAAVRMELNGFLAKGKISPREMADFQANMARLPPAERSEMLRLLTKAMNDGRIEGQF